jgi:hypothetical protein
VAALGLALAVAAVLCTWVFVGTTARADGRNGGTSRITRRSGGWALAAVVCSVVGVCLLLASVVRLWL